MTNRPGPDLDTLGEDLDAFLAAQPAFREFCRKPLVGAADAGDPRWPELRRVAHPEHRLPEEMLPGARSIVAWFLPFQPWLVRENRRGDWATDSWALAYVAVNELLAGVAAHLARRLAAGGFRAAADPPTHRVDREKLVAPWSHKHAAVICSLGSFGTHQMLITSAGAAGRCGSLVTDAALPPSPPVGGELCLARAGKVCRACVAACPVRALDAEPFDRHGCWARCQENGRRRGEPGVAQVCGKCAAVCPAPRRPDG